MAEREFIYKTGKERKRESIYDYNNISRLPGF
jgi:hypothetical protein